MSDPKSPDPLAEGRLAASSTVTVSNPYPAGSPEHALWLQGYEDAVGAEDDGLPSDMA